MSNTKSLVEEIPTLLSVLIEAWLLTSTVCVFSWSTPKLLTWLSTLLLYEVVMFLLNLNLFLLWYIIPEKNN
jgi:hypothetical protein